MAIEFSKAMKQHLTASLGDTGVKPFCIFEAPNAASVSVAILLSRLSQCPFVAKGCGHAAFTGASNIEGGITISLESLNTIQVSSDKKTVDVGPGNKWVQVYTERAKSDLAVVGGRVAPIGGVGGLTLGGGISLFSSIHGWASHNVVSYEVVLASGLIVVASPTKNKDLYWALRGGGNNFDLVKTFNFEAISLPGNDMWGGTPVYLEDDFPRLTQAFSNLVARSPLDPNAGQWIAWLVYNGTRIASTELWYAQPDGNASRIFDEYNTLITISDTTRNTKPAVYATSLNAANPYGLRETYYGLTVKLNQEIADLAKDIFYEELPSTADVAGVNPVLLYQGITTGQIKAMAKNGGNPSGLSPEEPLYLIHVACWWENAADDDTVYAFIAQVLDRITARAKERGVDNDYFYMNYASLYEDVIRGYGPDNKARLQRIARKYDPQQVFQKLQPGYFKLDRPPVVDARYFSG